MKRRSVWIRVMAPVLVMVLLFAAYQAFRFPAAFRRLSDHTLRESEVSRLNGTGQIDSRLEELGLAGEQGAFDTSGVTWESEVSDALRQTGNSDEVGNTLASEQASREEASYETEANDETTYPYEFRELYAQRGENRIYGRIYVPQNAGEIMPTVIFSHGFGGNYQVGVPYAEALAKKGYVAYCFDFCGGSPGSRSDGSTLEMSVLTEKEDLEAVLRMIQEQPFVDRENIFLMGTSMGGAVSAITAAAHEEEIRGAVLLYPAFIMEDSMKERFNSAEEIPDTFYHLWMTVGRAFAEDLLDYDMYGAASGYGRDVLLLHGDADDIVPLSYSEKAVEVYPSAELHVLQGAGHGFHGEDFDTAVSYVKSFLEREIQ